MYVYIAHKIMHVQLESEFGIIHVLNIDIIPIILQSLHAVCQPRPRSRDQKTLVPQKRVNYFTSCREFSLQIESQQLKGKYHKFRSMPRAQGCTSEDL